MRHLVLLLTTIACLGFGQLSLRIGPNYAPSQGPAGHAASTWQQPKPEKSDVLTRAERPSVVVAPASASKRLPAIPPGVPDMLSRLVNVVTFERGRAQECGASGYEQVRVRRHVPRMECGDPPRV